MVANEPSQLCRVGFSAAEVVHFNSGFLRAVALAHGLSPHADDALQALPLPELGPPAHVANDDDFTLLVAPAVLLKGGADFAAGLPSALYGFLLPAGAGYQNGR